MENSDFQALPDEDLVRRIGDTPTAFRTLYDRYAPRVFGLLATMRLDSNTSDDVAQQAWFKAWKSINTKPGESPFCPWLMQIVRNTAIDHLRKHRPAPLMDAAQIASDGPQDLLSHLEESAEMEQLRRCIGGLADLERRIFQNRLEGIGSPEIADKVGLSSDRVHRIFHDAKQKLKRCLGVAS